MKLQIAEVLKKKSKKTTWYLGYDGSYVLSRCKLHKEWDMAGQFYFLSTNRKNSIIDISDIEGRCLFPKMKMFQVLELQIQIKKSLFIFNNKP